MKSSTLLLFIFMAIFNTANSTQNNIMKTDKVQVKKWNNFVAELYELHVDKTKNIPILTTEIIGGYGGGFNNKEFYREISYVNKKTNKLISKIQWEVDNPNTIHTIEIFLYDTLGKIKTDFYARFLPYARNAPVQTLINLHNHNENLHAFRQFDANGELIYETCRGKFFNQDINLHLDNEEIQDFKINNTDEFLEETYNACFLNLAQTATAYLSPAILINKIQNNNELPIELALELISNKIIKAPKNAKLYLERGQLLFQLHDFEKAIQDFNTALSIDDSMQQAYFERGMALARNGQIEEGIADLTFFIKYNPTSSLAYTKRGVRYIWANKLELAKKDLMFAVKLNNTNSEAHDDLGVLYAQESNLGEALKHFSLAIQYDPTYQKAYHNLAMAYILKKRPTQALSAINKSLMLDHDSRNSLMLKSEILSELGREKESEAIMKKAEFLPEGNWSERFSIQ